MFFNRAKKDKEPKWVTKTYKDLLKGKEAKNLNSSRIFTKGDDNRYSSGDVLINDANLKKEDFAKNPKADSNGNKTMTVQSTAIDAVRYDEDTGNFYVKYKGGGKYYTFNCPPDVVKDFLRAGSKGRFAHYVLKQKYTI